MKRLFLLSALALAACGSEPSVDGAASGAAADPDPGSDLLVVFDAKDEGGNCVVNYSVYVSADAGLTRIGSDIITDDIMGGSGMGLRDLEAGGILKGDGFDRTIEGKACAEVVAASRPFQCFVDFETTKDCPPLRFEGTDVFASFEQKKW